MIGQRIYLVDGKRVSIIKTYRHTYHVRFHKTGKLLEIHKRYLKTWIIKPKKKVNKQKPDNPQTSLNL